MTINTFDLLKIVRTHDTLSVFLQDWPENTATIAWNWHGDNGIYTTWIDKQHIDVVIEALQKAKEMLDSGEEIEWDKYDDN